MGIMQMQFQEVTLKHDALHEQLVTCQTKCLGLDKMMSLSNKHSKRHLQGPLKGKKNA